MYAQFTETIHLPWMDTLGYRQGRWPCRPTVRAAQRHRLDSAAATSSHWLATTGSILFTAVDTGEQDIHVVEVGLKPLSVAMRSQ